MAVVHSPRFAWQIRVHLIALASAGVLRGLLARREQSAEYTADFKRARQAGFKNVTVQVAEKFKSVSKFKYVLYLIKITQLFEQASLMIVGHNKRSGYDPTRCNNTMLVRLFVLAKLVVQFKSCKSVVIKYYKLL